MINPRSQDGRRRIAKAARMAEARGEPQNDAALLAGLSDMFGEGVLLTDRRKKNVAPEGTQFEKGHKTNRRYSTDDVAIVCALRALGCTYYAIRQLVQRAFPDYRKGMSDDTLRRLLTGEVYADIRETQLFADRYQHYFQFFEAACEGQLKPTPELIQQAR